MKEKLYFFMLMMLMSVTFIYAGNEKIVIAHRGACGYLPEHTLEAKALAYGMGADFIEQDVVMTKDNKLIVMHDHYLDSVTNVAEIYPDKKRADGRYYVIDFTLDEIRKLRVTEAFSPLTKEQNFINRFPIWKSNFIVNTLEEEIEMIQGLNKSTGKSVGIYPEIKAPWFHKHENKDISVEVLKVLKKYGYTSKYSPIYLQCFDPNETMRIKNELFPKMGMELKLVQLIAETSWNKTMVYNSKGEAVPYNYDWIFEKDGASKISKYADGIGPWYPMLVKPESTKENIMITDMVKEAHKYKMAVHPYTFRAEANQIPVYADNFNEYLNIFYNIVDVDGVFTDFPDKALLFLKKNR